MAPKAIEQQIRPGDEPERPDTAIERGENISCSAVNINVSCKCVTSCLVCVCREGGRHAA